MNTAAESDTDLQEYLTFMLAGEEYGVDILKVQAIQGWSPVTPIPHSPEFVLGVTNLRGAVVPIIDLRLRFGLEKRELHSTTVVIIVSVCGETQERIVGMVVDGVSEVYAIESNSLQPAPDFGACVDTSFVQGLSTMDDRMLILLNIDRLLNDTLSVESINEGRLELLARSTMDT